MENPSNNHFCLQNYDCYGFDLDGCLLKYQWDNFFKYLHTYVVSHLKTGGYDSSLFKPYEESWRDVMFRGIVVDTQRGNALRVLGNGHIERAYHGTKVLTTEDIGRAYKNAKLPVLDQLLKNFNHNEEFHLIDNYFEGPLMMLYLDLVDAADKKVANLTKPYQELWDDIFRVYIKFFQNDSTESAGRFIDLTRDPASCCVTLSQAMRGWLRRLKADGKTVFIMTSSLMEFSQPMLNFLLGPDALDYFDFCIGKAGKPMFFYRETTFQDMQTLERNVQEIKPKLWYHEGNHKQFTKLLETFSGKKNPKVLYFGDGLKNDVFPSKAFADWGTVLVLEGLEALSGSSAHGIVSPGEQRYVSENPVWGSFLEQDGELTLFAKIISFSADLTVPWLDYIADLPMDHKFSTIEKTSYQGYYPPLKAVNTS